MSDKLRFNDRGNGGFYEPTDSEDEYSEEEKELLKKHRQGNRRKQDSKQEVLAFDDSDIDEDEDAEDEDAEDDVGELMDDSDIEGMEDDDDDMPDSKAWGSKPRNFYDTDFVDPDYSSYTEKEKELALAEEEEALAIQRRMAAAMPESSFNFDLPTTGAVSNSDDDENVMPPLFVTSEPSESQGVTKLTTNLSGLSRRDKLQYFQKDSPEFFGLTEDLLMGLKESETLLTPVLNYAKVNKLPCIPALEFAQMMNTLLTTYCSNISFYLMLKAQRISIKNHPISKRLLQLKTMLEQLSDRYEQIIKPQLEALLERIEDGDVFEIKMQKQEVDKTAVGKGNKLENATENETLISQRSSENEVTADEEDEEVVDDEERRSITYQIAKNKGLTPHRRKDLRNPRVKHRGKFRKALIRRKGAIRTVRTEIKRYGGEMSGIKSTVSKSVKFK